jgi:sugar phosphate isomerase/epimerase
VEPKLGVLEQWFDGEPVVPGDTLEERLANLEDAGYQGIQLNRLSMELGLPAIKRALAGSSIRLLIHGKGGRILGADQEIRDRAVADISDGLREAADLGAVGSLLVPVRTQPEIAPPPESSGKTVVDLEREILFEQLGKIAPVAEEVGIPVILEPLNRYESHLLKSLDDAAQICRAVGSPGIKMMGDFFHMNIEDDDMAQAIEDAADVLVYIHLADSSRYEPGTGHLDFTPGFAALKRIGYDGYLTIESKLRGGASVDTLARSADFIRRTWAAA